MSATRRRGGRAARLQGLGIEGPRPRPAAPLAPGSVGAPFAAGAPLAADAPVPADAPAAVGVPAAGGNPFACLSPAAPGAVAASAGAGTSPAAGTAGRCGAGAAAGRQRVLVLACGALGREIVTLRDLNGWEHLELVCLPAILHNHPGRIVPAIEAAVAEYRPHYARIFVAYADCGTGGLLAAACARLGLEMIPGPHCYAFYSGNAAFAQRDETRSFFLTDFLTRQFDAFVWRELGLDRHPELRDLYFGHYERLVYLAQTHDPALDAKAQEAARRLGLSFERRFTGLGDLETALAGA